jgi:hypothetical protein
MRGIGGLNAGYGARLVRVSYTVSYTGFTLQKRRGFTDFALQIYLNY